jgi:hypothetical protein
MAKLFGVFATHSPESCPMNKELSRDIFLDINRKLKAPLDKYRVNKVLGFYMSVLEHQWIIVIEAENAHDIETLCIESGISSYNTVKIVPLNDISVAVQRMEAAKTSSK